MTGLTARVLTTVNASYRVQLSAGELAAKLADLQSASSFDAGVFAFFSEVRLGLQVGFIEQMNVDMEKAMDVARQFALLSGFSLPLVTRGRNGQTL